MDWALGFSSVTGSFGSSSFGLSSFSVLYQSSQVFNFTVVFLHRVTIISTGSFTHSAFSGWLSGASKGVAAAFCIKSVEHYNELRDGGAGTVKEQVSTV